MNFAKNTTAALCFMAVLLALTGSPLPRGLSTEAMIALVVSGLLGLSVCDTFFLRSMMGIGPRKATLIMAGLAPGLVFVGAFFPPFSQTENALRVLPWVGFALALCGVALASSEVPDGPHDAAERRRGIRDGILAAFFQAAGILLSVYAFQEGAPPFEGAALRLVSGSAGLVVGGFALGRARSWTAALSGRGILRALILAAFFGTFIGISLNQAGLAWAKSTGAATTINSLAPVWLIPLSAIFLSERHGRRAWLSTVLALAGIALLAA